MPFTLLEMLRASDKENQIIVVAPDEVSRWLLRSLDLTGLLADDASPYGGTSGFVLGEGSFALVLEKMESAQARGAHIYAEILGYGSKCDSRSIFDKVISTEWMEKSMSAALHDADTTANEIDFAVGTGMEVNSMIRPNEPLFTRFLAIKFLSVCL